MGPGPEPWCTSSLIAHDIRRQWSSRLSESGSCPVGPVGVGVVSPRPESLHLAQNHPTPVRVGPGPTQGLGITPRTSSKDRVLRLDCALRDPTRRAGGTGTQTRLSSCDEFCVLPTHDIRCQWSSRLPESGSCPVGPVTVGVERHRGGYTSENVFWSALPSRRRTV